MDSNQVMAVVAVVEFIIMAIPIGTLIWKAAKLATRVEINEKDIEKLKDTMKEQVDTILSTLKEISASIQELKIDVKVIQATEEKKAGKDD